MRKQTNLRLPDKTRDQIEALQNAGFGTLTGIVQVAIDRMYQQEIGSHQQEKTMNSKKIDKNSVQQVAHDLFTKTVYQGQRVDIYADPDTGEIEAFLTGEIPPWGWVHILTDNDAYLYWGQDLCETEEELEDAFDRWVTEHLNDFVRELEDAWAEAL